MLHFSFSTVLMAFLASTAAAVLISIIFSHKTTVVCIGYKILIFLVGIVFVRLNFHLLSAYFFPNHFQKLFPTFVSPKFLYLKHIYHCGIFLRWSGLLVYS